MYYKIDSEQFISLKKIKYLPWGLISLICLSAFFGIIVMYSASQGNIYPWAIRQLLHFIMFFPIMILIAIIDIRVWLRNAYYFYIFALIMLLLVKFLGHTAMGATRWISFGGFKMQPSELAKLSTIFALAKFFHQISVRNISSPIWLLPAIMMVMLPFGLIMKQPDLGTAMLLLFISVTIFFAAGVKIWKFLTVLIAAVIAAPLIWTKLHDYQKKRILTFLNPESDPLASGYNIIQSKIAIGSGGIFGKGFMKGTQSQLDFLPEHQTDFVFTMIAEEFGFVGGVSILFVFTIIIIYGYKIAFSAKTNFAKLLAIGMISLFAMHVFVNMGMVMGLMPVVGVPLPFLTYGGTIMLTMLVAFGFLMNVHVHKDIKNI